MKVSLVKKYLSVKLLTSSLLLMLLAMVASASNSNTSLGDSISAKAQQQNQQTQDSVQHSAVGHESHQIVNLQNASEAIEYKGVVTFNSTKPVDIISYEDVTSHIDANATVKIWDVDGKKYATQLLLNNASEGTVNFQGAGILTHSPSTDPYRVTFSINAASLNGTNGK